MRIYSFSLIVLALTGAAHTFNLVTLDVVPPRSNTPSALPARSDLPTQLDKALPRSEACAQRAVSPNLSRRLSDLESANTERAPAMANRATGGSSTQEGRRPRSNSEALRRGLPLLRPFRRRSGYYPQPSCHPNKPCHHEAGTGSGLGGACSIQADLLGISVGLSCRRGLENNSHIDLAACLVFLPEQNVIACSHDTGPSDFHNVCQMCEMLDPHLMQCLCNGVPSVIAIDECIDYSKGRLTCRH